MIPKVLLIFYTVPLVYSTCQEKNGTHLKLCDVPPNEEFKVMRNGSNVYLRIDSEDIHVRDMTRPLTELGEQHYHFVVYLKVNYFNAFKFCSNLGMNLLNIETKQENDLLVDHIKQNYGTAKFFWTAGQDLGSPGEFAWLSTGKLLSYTNWAPGQPDNINNEEHCLLLSKEHDYSWADSNCWGRHFFICEVATCPYTC